MEIKECQLPIGETAELLYPESRSDCLLAIRAMCIIADGTNDLYSGFFSQYKILLDFIHSDSDVIFILPVNNCLSDLTNTTLWWSTFFPTCHRSNPNYNLLWKFAYSEKYQSTWGKLLKEIRGRKKDVTHYTFPSLDISFYNPYDLMPKYIEVFEKMEQTISPYILDNEEHIPAILNMRPWLKEAEELNMYSLDNIKIHTVDKSMTISTYC